VRCPWNSLSAIQDEINLKISGSGAPDLIQTKGSLAFLWQAANAILTDLNAGKPFNPSGAVLTTSGGASNPLGSWIQGITLAADRNVSLAEGITLAPAILIQTVISSTASSISNSAGVIEGYRNGPISAGDGVAYTAYREDSVLVFAYQNSVTGEIFWAERDTPSSSAEYVSSTLTLASLGVSGGTLVKVPVAGGEVALGAGAIRRSITYVEGHALPNATGTLPTFLRNKMDWISNQSAAGGMQGVSGTVATNDALLLGQKWVGEGYTVGTGPKGEVILFSSDGYRQFRGPTAKNGIDPVTQQPYSNTAVQVNFERRDGTSGAWTHNVHLDIKK
jgi:hypothetical protein